MLTLAHHCNHGGGALGAGGGQLVLALDDVGADPKVKSLQ